MYHIFDQRSRQMVTLAVTMKRPRASQLRIARSEWNPKMLRAPPKSRDGQPTELEVLWADGRGMFHCSRSQFADWLGSQGEWEELVHVVPMDDPGYVPQWFSLPNGISVWFHAGGKMPDWEAPPAKDYGSMHPEAEKWSSLHYAFRKHLYDNGGKVQRPSDGRKVIFHRMPEEDQIAYVEHWCDDISDTHPDKNWLNYRRYQTTKWVREVSGNEEYSSDYLSDNDVRSGAPRKSHQVGPIGDVLRRRITKEEAEGTGGEIKMYETLPPLPPDEADHYTEHTTLARALRVAKVPLRVTRAVDLWAAPRDFAGLVAKAVKPLFEKHHGEDHDIEIGVQWKHYQKGRWVVRMKIGDSEKVYKMTIDSSPAIEQALAGLHLDEARVKLTISKKKHDYSGEFSVHKGAYRVLSFDGWLNARSRWGSAWGNLEVNLTSVMAHEMTHARQSAEGYWHGNVSLSRIKKNPLLYYLDDCEIEAYVRQIVTEAHLKEEPFSKILSNFVKWQADYPDRRLHADERRKVTQAYTDFYNAHFTGYSELPPEKSDVQASVAASLGIAL